MADFGTVAVQPKQERTTVMPVAGSRLKRASDILVALTAVTVLASFWRAPNELVNVGIAITIATIKAAFVVRFFMHLKFEGKLIYTIFFAPLTLAIVLTIALIPDIALGRHTAFNDMVGMFEALVGNNGK